MDTYEIDNELEQARIDLENEERALQRAMDTSKTELAILQAEKSYQALVFEYEHAGTTLQLALQTIDNEYVNKQNEYLQAARAYERKEKDYQSMKKTYEDIQSLDKSGTILYADDLLTGRIEDLKFVVDGLRKDLDPLDQLMRYTDKYGRGRPDYEPYIGAKDVGTKNQVEILFWEVYAPVNQITEALKSSSLVTSTQIKSLLIQYYESLREIADKKTELSFAVEKMMEASIVSEGFFRSPVTISDGRSLKSSANAAIDEIL